VTNKVPLVKPKSKAQIELDIHFLLLKLQPAAFRDNSEIDIETIFEIDLPDMIPGLKTGYIDLSHLGTNVMGFTDAQKKVSFVHKELADATDTVSIRRFRATVAHEVSHCLYHLPALSCFKSLSSTYGTELYRVDRRKIKPYLDPEWQAWKYAGALLMPKERILKLIGEGCDEYDIADIFNVNPSFVKARMGALK
jgi:hypothetical protein